MSIRCLFGLHEPMKYTEVLYRGRRWKKCHRCGKLLAIDNKRY